MYICISCSLNIALLIMCGWGRLRARHEDLVLCNFLKQNCLFEIPKSLPGEGLQSSPYSIPEGCCVYSSRGLHPADAAGSWTGSSCCPSTLPQPALQRSFIAGKGLQASAAFVFLLTTAMEAACWDELFCSGQGHVSFWSAFWEQHPALGIVQPCLGTSWGMNEPCFQLLKPCLLLGLIRLS